MDTARNLAGLLALTMVAAILVGLGVSEQGAAGELLTNVWGVVTIIDLYLALGAAWAWIAWRERSPGVALLWAVLLVLLGSVALWGYVALAASRARSAEHLLLGDHGERPVHGS